MGSVKASVLMDKNKTLELSSGSYGITNDMGERGLGISKGILIIREGKAYIRFDGEVQDMVMFKDHLVLLLSDGSELSEAYVMGEELNICSNGEAYIDKLYTNCNVELTGEIIINKFIVCKDSDDLIGITVENGKVNTIDVGETMVIVKGVERITIMNIDSDTRNIISDRMKVNMQWLSSCSIVYRIENDNIVFDVLRNDEAVAVVDKNSDIYDKVFRKYKETLDRKIRQRYINLVRHR